MDEWIFNTISIFSNKCIFVSAPVIKVTEFKTHFINDKFNQVVSRSDMWLESLKVE